MIGRSPVTQTPLWPSTFLDLAMVACQSSQKDHQRSWCERSFLATTMMAGLFWTALSDETRRFHSDGRTHENTPHYKDLLNRVAFETATYSAVAGKTCTWFAV